MRSRPVSARAFCGMGASVSASALDSLASASFSTGNLYPHSVQTVTPAGHSAPHSGHRTVPCFPFPILSSIMSNMRSISFMKSEDTASGFTGTIRVPSAEATALETFLTKSTTSLSEFSRIRYSMSSSMTTAPSFSWVNCFILSIISPFMLFP